MIGKRKHFSGAEKVSALRRHLLDHDAVSDVCDELDLAPTVFYRWQKEFFENGAAAFERKSKHQQKQVRLCSPPMYSTMGPVCRCVDKFGCARSAQMTLVEAA